MFTEGIEVYINSLLSHTYTINLSISVPRLHSHCYALAWYVVEFPKRWEGDMKFFKTKISPLK